MIDDDKYSSRHGNIHGSSHVSNNIFRNKGVKVRAPLLF